MTRYKQATLTASLPPVPITPEMRQQIETIASQKNKTLSQLQREALSLFLSMNIGETDTSICTANK